MEKRAGGKEIVKNSNKYFFWAFLLLLIILCYLILKSYLVALISSFILAYLVRPVYLRIERKSGKNLAAIICILLILAVVLIPTWFVFNALIQQTGGYFTEGVFDSVSEKLLSYPLFEKLNTTENIAKVGSAAGKLFTSTILSLPRFLISILLALVAVYYILVDWEKIVFNLKRSIPLYDKEKIVKEISEITNVMVYGTLFVGLIEFAVASIGFYLLGIKFYLLIGGLIFLFAFIPGLGPTIVWVPLAIYYFIYGQYGIALGVLIIGLILSVGLDLIFKTKLLGRRSKMNPLIILLGILGGIPLFGFFGFVIGPLILAYTVKIVQQVVENY